MGKIYGLNLCFCLVYSDASGYTVEHGSLVTSEIWSAKEAAQSSTWKELCKKVNEQVRWFAGNLLELILILLTPLGACVKIRCRKSETCS